MLVSVAVSLFGLISVSSASVKSSFRQQRPTLEMNTGLNYPSFLKAAKSAAQQSKAQNVDELVSKHRDDIRTTVASSSTSFGGYLQFLYYDGASCSGEQTEIVAVSFNICQQVSSTVSFKTFYSDSTHSCQAVTFNYYSDAVCGQLMQSDLLSNSTTNNCFADEADTSMASFKMFCPVSETPVVSFPALVTTHYNDNYTCLGTTSAYSARRTEYCFNDGTTSTLSHCYSTGYAVKNTDCQDSSFGGTYVTTGCHSTVDYSLNDDDKAGDDFFTSDGNSLKSFDYMCNQSTEDDSVAKVLASLGLIIGIVVGVFCLLCICSGVGIFCCGGAALFMCCKGANKPKPDIVVSPQQSVPMVPIYSKVQNA